MAKASKKAAPKKAVASKKVAPQKAVPAIKANPKKTVRKDTPVKNHDILHIMTTGDQETVGRQLESFRTIANYHATIAEKKSLVAVSIDAGEIKGIIFIHKMTPKLLFIDGNYKVFMKCKVWQLYSDKPSLHTVYFAADSKILSNEAHLEKDKIAIRKAKKQLLQSSKHKKKKK